LVIAYYQLSGYIYISQLIFKKENGLKFKRGVLFKNDGWDFLTFLLGLRVIYRTKIVQIYK